MSGGWIDGPPKESGVYWVDMWGYPEMVFVAFVEGDRLLIAGCKGWDDGAGRMKRHAPVTHPDEVGRLRADLARTEAEWFREVLRRPIAEWPAGLLEQVQGDAMRRPGLLAETAGDFIPYD